MAGQSDREKEAQEQQKRLNEMLSSIQGQNFQVQNLFQDYKDPFGYTDMKTQLDQMLSSGKADINRETAENIANYQKGVSGRYASQGIGGPMLEEAIREGRSKLAKDKLSALSQLTQFGAGKNIDLMNIGNQNKFRNTGASQNVLGQNINNLFQKYGLMGGTMGQMQGNLQNFDDTTWFDDLLGVLNTASGFINPLDKLFGGETTEAFGGATGAKKKK